MLSAGLIGGPGLGYCKDKFAGEELNKENPAVYAEYKAANPSKFLNIESTATYGLDGTKLGDARDANPRTPDQQTVIMSPARPPASSFASAVSGWPDLLGGDDTGDDK